MNILDGMPHRRQDTSSTDWTASTARSPNENWLSTPRDSFAAELEIRSPLEEQFDTLLVSKCREAATRGMADPQDDLQISDSVRQKFSSVSHDVKSSLLSSTYSSNPALLSALGLPVPTSTPKIRKKVSTPFLRKAKSSSSLGSPGPLPQVGRSYKVDEESFEMVASPLASPYLMATPPRPIRGLSLDVQTSWTSSRLSTPLRPMSMSYFDSPVKGRGLGINGVNAGEREGPGAFVTWLGTYRTTDKNMDVGRCKKLRMLLRHETTGWTAEFLELGGYELVLKRLQELLDVEWRSVLAAS